MVTGPGVRVKRADERTSADRLSILELQETAHFFGHPSRLRHEGEMPGIGQTHQARAFQPVAEGLEALPGYEQVAVACEQQGRHPDATEPVDDVELLDQSEAMRHHALIGLPALGRHELEQRPLLLAAKEEVEELIDEGVVYRQQKTRPDRAGHLLEQAAL